MANLKWPASMLLILIINLSFLIFFLKTTLRDNQGVSDVSTSRIVDPFTSAIKKYWEQKRIASTDKVAIELSSMDQKIKIILSVARIYGKPLSFSQQSYIATTTSGHLKREPLTSDSGMSITQTNIIPPTNGISRQPHTASPQTTPLPQVTTSSTRLKRELIRDSEMSFKQETTNPPITRVTRQAPAHSQETTQFQDSTGREVSTTATLTSLYKVSAQSGRAVRDALTPSPQTTLLQEVTTSTGHKESFTPASQTTMLPESSTTSDRFSREASTKSGMSKKEKSTITSIYRVLRALSTSAPQTKVVQEIITPTGRISSESSTELEMSTKEESNIPSMDRIIRETVTSTPKKTLIQEITTSRGGDIKEQSTLDLFSSTKQETTIPPKIKRDAPMPTQTSQNQEVTKPRSRVFREISTQIPITEESMPPIHKKPFLRKCMEGFIRDSFSALKEELKQVKLLAMKRITNLNDDPTFPPPTDPEGTDF